MMQSVLYIGTDAGVFTARSGDLRSWKIADHGLRKWEITEIAVSPAGPNKAFAATRGDGVWVTEDFGQSWIKPSYGRRGPGKVRSVTIDPHDPKRLYAGCEPVDIFVSEDEGKNWLRFDSVWDVPSVAAMPYPLASVEPHVRDVTVDPVDADILYAALQLGHIIKSTDCGRSWKLLDRNLDCDVHTILVDPRSPRRLVIATGGHGSRQGEAPGRALYASEDGGMNWTATAMNFAQDYAVPLVRDPHDPARLFCALAQGTAGRWRKRASGAEAIVIRSGDGGMNWHRVGEGVDGKEFPEAIVVDDAAPGIVYAASRNGSFYASDDAGDSWHSLRLDLKVDDLSSLAITHA
ncbi:hypothetical protein [Bradyrhizobium sp.]|uniref:WD40/YVTN/BNR-like repeat-containing protein n=1 Tax=Bradyrhizobium sp. TaxID=376 RepID=UPI002D5260FE|nr:hypothetical protein [Bradyrhizobium sp.]HZR73049.1 hypothetical protein [Bradyrhizobium sp.]